MGTIVLGLILLGDIERERGSFCSVCLLFRQVSSAAWQGSLEPRKVISSVTLTLCFLLSPPENCDLFFVVVVLFLFGFIFKGEPVAYSHAQKKHKG